MDGDMAPLAELAFRDQQATLMVDDAHGLGVLGVSQGQEVLRKRAWARMPRRSLMATLGKALGVAGRRLSPVRPS